MITKTPPQYSEIFHQLSTRVSTFNSTFYALPRVLAEEGLFWLMLWTRWSLVPSALSCLDGKSLISLLWCFCSPLLLFFDIHEICLQGAASKLASFCMPCNKRSSPAHSGRTAYQIWVSSFELLCLEKLGRVKPRPCVKRQWGAGVQVCLGGKTWLI